MEAVRGFAQWPRQATIERQCHAGSPAHLAFSDIVLDSVPSASLSYASATPVMVALALLGPSAPVIWVVDELTKPPHYRLRLRLDSRLTDAQSDTLPRAAYDLAIAAKRGLASGQQERWAARVAQRRGSETELVPRHSDFDSLVESFG
jgi:hypothetical protein